MGKGLLHATINFSNQYIIVAMLLQYFMNATSVADNKYIKNKVLIKNES